MRRTDDLGINNLKLIQDTELFCFGTDSVLLANFARASKGDRVLDLCTGNGIVPVLMSAKTNAEKFYAIELQQKSFELAKENVCLNGLDERIEIICADIGKCNEFFKAGSIDVVTCNPPYMSPKAGFTNPEDALAIARHEIMTNLEGVISAAASVIKFGGHFYMVHRAERLCDIMCVMRNYRIEPKRLQFVVASPEKAPKLILVEGIYGANPSLKIENPKYVNI